MTRALRATAILLACFSLFAGIGAGMAEDTQPATLDLHRPSPSGSFLAGRGAAVSHHNAAAAQFFLDALEFDWNNPLLADRAFVALASAGDFKRAAPMAQRLIEMEPGHELARLVLGAMALRERRYTSAINHLSDMSTSSLLGITGNVLEAWAMIGAGRSEEALALVASIEEEGFAEFLRFHRGLMAELGGKRELALELLSSAYESDPFVFRIVEAYARTLANGGDFAGARAVLDKFYGRGVTHPMIDVVSAAVDAGQRPGLFVENVQEGAAEMLLGLGTALGSDSVSDLGIVFLRMALQLDPGADVVSITLAEMFERAGRFETANEIYDRIATDSPLRLNAVISKARNLEELGDRTDAINSLGNIAALHPESFEAVSALGDLLRADKQYEAAADAYTKALEISGGDKPADWRYYYVRGIAYERAKLWPQAEPDFKRALELNPEQPQVLNYLGYSWVDQGLNLDEALAMIQAAVDLRPNDGYIIDSLGWAYYRLGRFNEAVDTLERAAALMPDDPTINDHLGDAYWRVSRHLEAGFQWTIAKDLGPEEPGLLEQIDLKLDVGLDAALEAGRAAGIELDQ